MQTLTDQLDAKDEGKKYDTFYNVSTNFCVKDFPPKLQLELKCPGFTEIIKRTEECLIRKNKMSKKRAKYASKYFIEYAYRIINKKTSHVKNNDVHIFRKYFSLIARDFENRQM